MPDERKKIELGLNLQTLTAFGIIVALFTGIMTLKASCFDDTKKTITDQIQDDSSAARVNRHELFFVKNGWVLERVIAERRDGHHHDTTH